KNGDNYDINNNSGYVFELYNEDKPVPGALAAKSNFHLQMDSYIGIEAPHTDSILHWLKTDIEQYPDIEEDWLKTYAKTLLKNDRAKGEKYLKEGLVDLEEKEKSSEKDYTILTFIYDQLQEADKKDSIQKLAIKQYPKGKAAQEGYNTKFIKAASHEEQTEIFKAYQKNIGKDGRIKDAMLSRLDRKSTRLNSSHV